MLIRILNRRLVYVAATLTTLTIPSLRHVHAQSPAPSVLDSNLAVRTVTSGLNTPTSMAFLGNNEFLVLEKSTGNVKHVVNGIVVGVALDLAVNNASERGLLGIELHPNFSTNHFVYLYWSCQGTPQTGAQDNPDPECADTPGIGADSGDISAAPLLGNRVDRFVWNGSTLAYDRNLIKLRAYQNDGADIPAGQGDLGQVRRGNHNGGVIRFGPDGKLYIIIGDNGRRGQLQNLVNGPTPPTADDQFGGPMPDRNHLTGVIVRLNDDGSTPSDNPFYAAGASMPAASGPSVQKIYAYGVRNSFGMAFDPIGGNLWTQENGDDSFDEINRVEPGMDGGWIQIIGPVSRISQFKEIETTFGNRDLQQLRWLPANIANTPEEALSRLFVLPGARYKDPAFSWKWAVAPGGIGFVKGRELGQKYRGDLIVGASTPTLEGGYLFHFSLNGNRRKIKVDDQRLKDRVADNTAKFNITESESLLFGRNFGVTTDIQTGPNGNLFVVSLSNGAVYEVFRTE